MLEKEYLSAQGSVFLLVRIGLAGVPNYGIFETLPPGENAVAGGTLFSIPGMIIGGFSWFAQYKNPDS